MENEYVMHTVEITRMSTNFINVWFGHIHVFDKTDQLYENLAMSTQLKLWS